MCKKFSSAVAVALLGLAATSHAANPNSLCMPQPAYVPGLSGPPNWLTPNQWDGDPSHGYDWINDPRWTGALEMGYVNGSAYDVSVRAVSYGTPPVLYLSWNIRFDPLNMSSNPASINMLYFGLFPEDGSGLPAQTGYVFKIALNSPNTCGGTCPADKTIPVLTGQANPAYAPPVGATAFDVTPYQETAANSWAQTAPPWWNSVTANIKVSKLPSSPYTWNVEAAVPIDSNNLIGPNLLPNGATKFLFWQDTHLVIPSVGIIPYTWPRAGATPGAYEYQVSNPANTAPPDPFTAATQWGEIQLQQLNPSCPVGGIALNDYTQVGTHNAPTATDPSPADDEVRGNGVNVLFAKPTNNYGSSIPTGQLNVTFRVADWGSVADPTAPWIILPSTDAVNQPLGLKNVPTTAPIAPFGAIDLEQPLAKTTMDLSTADTSPGTPAFQLHCDFVGNGVDVRCPGPPTRPTDNCIQVSLEGSADFSSASVTRNMSWTHASRFARNAQINIAGLPSLGAPKRDVYVAIEQQNMPGFPTYGTGLTSIPSVVPPPSRRRETQSDIAQAASVVVEASLTTSQPPGAQFLKLAPIYIVHAFYDTGRKGTIGGVTYPILAPQSSFGYLMQHNGPLFGWQSEIAGAAGTQITQLASDLYKLSVPEGGRVMVTTMVNTIDLGTWWLWLVIIAILLLLYLLVRLLRRLI